MALNDPNGLEQDALHRRNEALTMYRLLFERPPNNEGLPESLQNKVEIKEGAGAGGRQAVAFCMKCHYVVNEDIGRGSLLANLEGHFQNHQKVCIAEKGPGKINYV